MFAGKLPAGATAFKGNVSKVYLCLIGFAATALALAPKCYIAGSPAYPFGWIGQVFPRFFGRFVGRQAEYLFFSELQEEYLL